MPPSPRGSYLYCQLTPLVRLVKPTSIHLNHHRCNFTSSRHPYHSLFLSLAFSCLGRRSTFCTLLFALYDPGGLILGDSSRKEKERIVRTTRARVLTGRNKRVREREEGERSKFSDPEIIASPTVRKISWTTKSHRYRYDAPVQDSGRAHSSTRTG